MKVIFVNSYPKEIMGENEMNIYVDTVKKICKCVQLNELDNSCEEYREIKIADKFKDLVYYHYETEGMHSFMFFNESVSEVLDTKIIIPKLGYEYGYDAYENKLYSLSRDEEGETYDE